MLSPTPTSRTASAPLARAASVIALAVAVVALSAAPSFAAFLPTNADFNGHGFSDLPVGAPTDSVRGQDAAGAVNMLDGGGAGLRVAGDSQFTQSSRGVADAPERGDRFGDAVAAGDFDGDGYGDLAAAAPGEDVPTGIGPGERARADAGMVHVL